MVNWSRHWPWIIYQGNHSRTRWWVSVSFSFVRMHKITRSSIFFRERLTVKHQLTYCLPYPMVKIAFPLILTSCLANICKICSLAYYCIIHVTQSSIVSRLYTMWEHPPKYHVFGLKLLFFLCGPNEFPHSCPINLIEHAELLTFTANLMPTWGLVWWTQLNRQLKELIF